MPGPRFNIFHVCRSGHDGYITQHYANAHFNRGSVLKKMNRLEEALASYDRAIALKPDHAEAHNNRGVVLQELKLYGEALASYDRAIAVNATYGEAHNNRGTVLMSLGRMPEAERMFQRALELKPDFPDPWFNLANIRKHETVDEAGVKSIEALLGGPGITPEGREHLYFTLGKIYDDGGRFEEAFKCYERANGIRNGRVSYDAASVARLTKGIMEVFSGDFLAAPFAFASESGLPLFIVGMPRAGTTLLAHILSNHPAVGTAGELREITNFASGLVEGEVSYPQAARALAAGAGTRLTGDYEKRLRRDSPGEVRYVIDKNPLNFRHLGLIAKLFPRARMIHCTRHPLATGLSNYFQRFPLHLDYSFDLGNIGHFYGEYARLMRHWREMGTLRMIEISYEDMILNTESAARRALGFLELEWDARCLAPHTNPCPVETASQWQVRQPIYRDSLEHWRNYETHLGPLKEGLRRAEEC
jgi:tetratricopeptide (TPR) repeat protein